MARPAPPTEIQYRWLVEAALREDLGIGGDLTSWCIAEHKWCKAAIVSKDREDVVVCGTSVASLSFTTLDSRCSIHVLVEDGCTASPGTEIMRVAGPARAILAAERTALNFLSRLSGMATAAAKLVHAVEGTGCKVLDTRKTTPGWRVLEKYAARCGGAINHRFSLDHAVLLKDNHLNLLEDVGKAIQGLKEKLGHSVAIQVEAETLETIKEAAKAGADAVLLDNMSPQEVSRAVRLAKSLGLVVEVSGGITPDNARSYAEAGPDFLSSGWITHSGRWANFSLEIVS